MSSNPGIAIVGLACEFPGSSTPGALWETALRKHRWFRDIPSTRLGEGYFDGWGKTMDTTHLRRAAVIEGYAFPQQRFSIGSNDLLAADLTHWLALDCADRALTDSGLKDLLPRNSTRVIVGNSLTGESSRAELLRLRWPYFRKTLEESGCTGTETDWIRREQAFKARLTPIDGRTLAGSLSNVIAGRISNHFNLHGGAYCVDAACASSLLAISQACSQLASKEIDCCIVGAVDVSLDPLELVGFSVAGALARGEMTVFDRNRNGFLPGEGCGFAVLMRADHPAVKRCGIRAFIQGWAVSSDGRYDLTAPSPEGQQIALDQAYSMAGYGIDTVGLFEAHGTGTVIGDQVEISVLNSAISKAPSSRAVRAVVSSIKANIGHTKAAAGMAGLIKAVMALETRILPPVTGCNDPMPEFTGVESRLRLLSQGEAWPKDTPLRAGVSGFGFGGVNAHVTLEATEAGLSRNIVFPVQWDVPEQDAEIFVFDGLDVPDLRRRIEKVKAFAMSIADAELASAAAATVQTIKNRPWRAAVVSSSPRELDQRLTELLQWLIGPTQDKLVNPNIYLGRADNPPRIGFLFPGQGGRETTQHGKIWRRFEKILNSSAPIAPTDSSPINAAAVQAAIVSCAAAATKLLSIFGVEPSVCLGHSLGEISAFHASGVLSENAAVTLARDRGRLMDEQPSTRGRMEILFTDRNRASQLVNGHPVSLAAFNSATQTVIAGPLDAVAAVVLEAAKANVKTTRLPVHFAFHSPLMQAVAEPFSLQLRHTDFAVPRRTVYSTVTGESLSTETDFQKHLVSQLTSPVRFQQAFEAANQHSDLWIEVGAGRVLSGLVVPVNSTSIEADQDSLIPFLRTLAFAFVHGADIRFELLSADRYLPAFDLDWVPRFFTNPCERPLPPLEVAPIQTEPTRNKTTNPLEAVRQALAKRKGEDVSTDSIQAHQTLGPDLGMDSLGLMELTVAVEKALGCRPNNHPLKKMTVAEFAGLFRASPGGPSAATTLSDQLAPWVRAFEVAWDEVPLPSRSMKPCAVSEAAWTVVSHSPSSFNTALTAQLGAISGSLLIHCGKETDEQFLATMLASLHSQPDNGPIVFLDSTGELPGFAKSIALEQPTRPILFVHFPNHAPPPPTALGSELCSLSAFREVRFDAEGRRFLPHCRAIQDIVSADEMPVSSKDVVLVTGGAKGITAECIVALAGCTGASFAIVGRSTADDRSVLATREKLAAMGIAHDYWTVDISDPAAAADLLGAVTDSLGPITAIVHGAGTHAPFDVPSLSCAILKEHCRAKVDGLRNLLSVVNSASLKLVVAFGSVIARSGYARSAAYAFANDRLAKMVAAFQTQHNHIRCLTLDWSAWLETGMGVNLGAIAEMKEKGVDPVRNEDGIRSFLDALRHPSSNARPILAGRLPSFPTISFRAEVPKIGLPQGTVISHTPSVEIVADATLSLETHPFLAGHSIDGQVILPGVLILNLMAKTAATLGLSESLLHISDVTFSRPISLPATRSLPLRIQALRKCDGSVQCRLAPSGENLAESPAAFATIGPAAPESMMPVPSASSAQLTPAEGTALAAELYQHLLFHTGSFRIIERYSTAEAKKAVFHLHGLPESNISFESETLIRDAIIHGIQICVPRQMLLPSSIGFIKRYAEAKEVKTIMAAEVSSRDGEYIYDVTARDANGLVVEIWKGLVFRQFRSISLSLAHLPVLKAIDRERSGNQSTSPLSITPSGERCFEFRHIVGFKDTNLVGNVYFTNHLEWQGRCREMFLHQYAPDVLQEVQSGHLALITVSCSCEYLAELQPFDQISIRMTLEAQGADWVSMRFDYWRESLGIPMKIARGYQKVASRRRTEGGLSVTAMPESLVSALQSFS